MIREIDWNQVKQEFHLAKPFNHVVIDNFFNEDVANQLSDDFPDYDDQNISKHENLLEDKRTMNSWGRFPKTTYKTFMWLGSNLTENLKTLVDNNNLIFDYGLHGGGWHMHRNGGNNNVHLDYSVHPKLGLQRKLNVIVYLTRDWNPQWNGGLELWSHNEETKRPKDKIKSIDNIFNRCIIFDTTQNSWHGLPKKIECPAGIVRKSIAGYYLIPAEEYIDTRSRALFAPREDQIGNTEVENLIVKRSIV